MAFFILDAHADLRKNLTRALSISHASVMRKYFCVSHKLQKRLVSGRWCGILCEEEISFLLKKEKKGKNAIFDADLSDRLFFRGEFGGGFCAPDHWGTCPSHIHIFSGYGRLVPGATPPGTGTPVPGGLSFSQLICLFLEIKRQNKKLVSFDIVETACKGKNDPFREWNGNVAARLIYFLSGLALEGQNN